MASEFDEKYFRKAEKDLSQNDLSAKVMFYIDNPAQLSSIRLEFEWWLENSRVAFAIAFLNLEFGTVFFPHFVVEEAFQGKGLFTALAKHALAEWPKRGVSQVRAAHANQTARAIFLTGGFEDPETPLQHFALNLSGPKAKSLRAYFRNGSDEPEWRVEAKQEIAAILRVNDSQE